MKKKKQIKIVLPILVGYDETQNRRQPRLSLGSNGTLPFGFVSCQKPTNIKKIMRTRFYLTINEHPNHKMTHSCNSCARDLSFSLSIGTIYLQTSFIIPKNFYGTKKLREKMGYNIIYLIFYLVNIK